MHVPKRKKLPANPKSTQIDFLKAYYPNACLTIVITKIPVHLLNMAANHTPPSTKRLRG